MRKILFGLLLSLLCFVGCQQNISNGVDELTLIELTEEYESLCGAYFAQEDAVKYGIANYTKIIIASDSISLGSTQHSINIENNVRFGDDKKSIVVRIPEQSELIIKKISSTELKVTSVLNEHKSVVSYYKLVEDDK